MNDDLMDSFMDALNQNMDAEAPDALDAETATLLRELVRAQKASADPAVKARIWEHALADAAQETTASLNDHSDKRIGENPMTTFVPAQTSMRRNSLMLTLAVTAAVTLLFVSIIVTIERYSNQHVPALALQETEEPVDLLAMFDRYINEALVEGNMDVLDEILSPRHILNGRFGQDTHTGLRQTKALLESWFHLVTDITVQDVVIDEDSVWARIEMTQTIQSTTINSNNDPTDPTALAMMNYEDSELTLVGVMLVYFDESTDLFDETYFFLSQESVILNPPDPYDHMNNTFVAQMAIAAFWNTIEINLEDRLIIDMNEIYAPDYQLNVQNNGGETLRIPEGQTVEEFFAVVRGNITASIGQTSLEIINITASGNFVFADVEIDNGGTLNFEATFIYHVVDGKIVEEWWDSEQELFRMAAPD